MIQQSSDPSTMRVKNSNRNGTGFWHGVAYCRRRVERVWVVTYRQYELARSIPNACSDSSQRGLTLVAREVRRSDKVESVGRRTHILAARGRVAHDRRVDKIISVGTVHGEVLEVGGRRLVPGKLAS